MAFCPSCGQEVHPDMIFCPRCGQELVGKQSTEPASVDYGTRALSPSYNKALRWVSGTLGVVSILAAIGGLDYYAESGLVSELIVDIVSLIIGIACLVMAFAPHWVNTRLKIKLEKNSVFGAALVTAFVVLLVANGLGPEPPGGWWGYGG